MEAQKQIRTQVRIDAQAFVTIYKIAVSWLKSLKSSLFS